MRYESISPHRQSANTTLWLFTTDTWINFFLIILSPLPGFFLARKKNEVS